MVNPQGPTDDGLFIAYCLHITEAIFNDTKIIAKFGLNLNKMTREILIKKTIDHLTKLPDQKLKEVADFAEFLLNRMEDQLIIEGIQKLTTDSKTYKFLETEEDLYSVSDLKEKYK